MKNDSPQNFDAALDAALARLPNAPLASNFTARVLHSVELEEKNFARSRRWNWRALFPRTAFATAILLLAGFIFHQHEATARRAAFGQTLAQTISAQPMPSVEALKNFDAIQRMSQSQHADGELLALLQ